jgi:hypothetical protein
MVGTVKDLEKTTRVPARLWKAAEEPAPLPKAIPAADKFSWDGMGLDPNAESEEHRAQRRAEIQKEGAAAAILWKKRSQEKNWTEVKADLSVYAYSGGVVSVDPRREKSYVEAVLLGLGLGPRKPGEPIPEQFKHLTEYDIAALREVNARKAAVYWVEGSPRTTVRFMKHDTIPTGPPVKVPPHNLKGEAAQWVDDQLESEHKRGQLERGNSAWGSPPFPTKAFEAHRKQRKRRMVIDYRAVNKRTRRAVYYVRRQEDVKAEAAGSAFLTFLDAVTGFNQVVNTQRAREMLAVLSRSGCWLPRCLTFGPHNGPEDFSYVVDRLFSGGGKSRRRFCSTWLAYVDDITVRSGRYAGGRLYTDEEYAELVRTAVIKPQDGRQSLSEVLKEAGFDLVEDKLGVELPDGRKKKPPKDGRVKPLDVPNFDNAKRDTNAPYAHAAHMSGSGSSGDVACQSIKNKVFFEAWPYISEWIKSNRDKMKRRLVEKMCRRQRTHPLQVAFYRLRLAVARRRQGWGYGDPQNPTDPYRGWDNFFWLDTFEGPRTIEEEWVLRSLHSMHAPHRFHDQAVARAERVYAERERIRLQPDNDYERFMSDVELRELRQRRLDYVDESDVENSDSSDEDTTLLWGRTLGWQAEADLEAHDARVASDAEWLEQNLRWHEDARQEQEERDALSDVD